MDDKRTQIRLRIQDGRLKYKHDLGFTMFSQYKESGDLLDISKSGAGFLITKPLNLQDLIKVKILIPGEQSLVLRGQVRWIGAEKVSGKQRVGMQFAPYGNRRDYNSPNKLARLSRLSEIYLRANRDTYHE